MDFILKEVPICADKEFEMIKITDDVRKVVEESGVEKGIVYVITEHTTTGITVNESLPCVEKDLMECLDRIAPEDYPYHHNHYLPTYGTIGGNAPGHLKSLLTGNHCVFPVLDGTLKLGHAVDIYFCEYDGIKNRRYMVYVVGKGVKIIMKRTLAMADNCIDVYYKLDRYYLTGNSIDFALNYKDLGGDVTEMTILGNDVFADALEERLKEREIPLRILKRTDRPTAAAKMDLVDGDKKHLHFEGNAMEEIELQDDDLEFVKQFDIIYAERWAKVGRYIKEIRQEGQIWVYDFSKRLEQESNDEIIPYLDYAFFSYDRDDEYIRNFMVKTNEKGAKTVVAMLGEYGSLAYENGKFYKLDAEKVEVVNTVGAGDSYIAAFTYGVSLGEDIMQCMRRGRQRATEIIQQFNPYK